MRKKIGRGRNSLSPSLRDNCRLCVKFGSQGDQIGNENLQFQPSKQTGSFDVILAKLYVWKCWIANRILRAKDQSDRVCSSSGKKIRTLHQLYSFVSSVLFSSENERSESEERFKRPVQALPSNPGGGAGRGWYCHSYMGHIGMCRSEWYGFQAVYSGIGYMNTVNPLLSPPPLSSPLLIILHQLTIIPRARMGSESIVHEAERPNGLLTQRLEGERNNCSSKIQLVGQKYRDKTTLASKTRFSRHCFGFQSAFRY